jgi:hypothetical protein
MVLFIRYKFCLREFLAEREALNANSDKKEPEIFPTLLEITIICLSALQTNTGYAFLCIVADYHSSLRMISLALNIRVIFIFIATTNHSKRKNNRQYR